MKLYVANEPSVRVKKERQRQVIGLTDIQRETLLFIARHVRDKGYPPTIREIGARFDMASTNAISDRLRALERKGRIVRGAGCARGISLTEKGWAEAGGTPKRRVTVRHHEDGFLACLDGNVAQAFGKSSASAIGRLVMVAEEMFGVQVDVTQPAREAA